MKDLCIVGTDTDAGKTIVTAGVANFLKEKKLNFDVQKWVSTGDKINFSADLSFVYNSLNASINDSIKKIYLQKFNFKKSFRSNNPFSFKFPASPHLSAYLENKKISIKKIITSYNYLSKRNDYLIIEGVGGILVPLTKKILLIDVIKSLDLPVIIVSPNVLGTINKTLLTINVLKNYKIKILGIIYSNHIKENNKIRSDNIKIISKFSHIPALGSIPKLKTKKDLLQNFTKIGNEIIKKL